ncbi:hypothetical protein MmiHf6_03710 [Methanimicrococcus hongohii]|uniref:DUF2073 domain-containing protein n=1 Tax=Methanimicrococcus hongohii TaxID=3028295 RepID=A0AA96V9R3_9EURY|nr:DUF2073 domain-containing protein [Methanimicrococcus sp. Hf6]WNY23072.1 hypothetical protein MmiHf6_03710 [Methanimicrococcus sp. Hf6]
MSDIQLDLVSDAKLSRMGSTEKVRYIIDEVRKGKIMVLEKGLDPMEEAKLIEMTMTEIQEDFYGLEIESYPRDEGNSSFFGKLLKKDSGQQKLTVIGPANQLKTLRKDNSLISTLVSTK